MNKALHRDMQIGSFSFDKFYYSYVELQFSKVTINSWCMLLLSGNEIIVDPHPNS